MKLLTFLLVVAVTVTLGLILKVQLSQATDETRLRGDLEPSAGLQADCIAAEGEGCIDPPGPERGIIPAGGADFRDRDGIPGSGDEEFGAEVLNVALPGGSGPQGIRRLDVCHDNGITTTFLCRIQLGRVEGVTVDSAEGSCEISEEEGDTVPDMQAGDTIFVSRRVNQSPADLFNPNSAVPPVADCTGFVILTGTLAFD